MKTNLEKKRPQRVAGAIQKTIMSLILNELRDPRVANVTVTSVQMTDDLQLAKVYVRHLMGYDEKIEKDVLAGLKSASIKIRKEVAKEIGLRQTPELRFYFDKGQEARDRIEHLLMEIAQEPSVPNDE
jgi:ribosome-binding factor A